MSKNGDRLQSLFASALALDSIEREAFLARECADDPALLAQLRGLLNADAKLAGTTARPIALGLTQILASTAPGASLSGLRIGPFELREELGRGGMGLVYRAERVDGTVEQQVAIKFVRRELLDANTLKRFQLERQMLASLDHPNIARLLDASELEDGTPYYVMEYVPGAPITEHCDRAGASVRERVALVRTVCGAVAHAHRNLIVHRDLKPSNIHVSDAGVPKLLDFGIAKPLRAGHEATGTAERFFSPQYAAPEQVLGQPVGVGCDVYALGLILFELLAGRPAFELEGLTAGQAERQICEVPAPAPSAVTVEKGRARELRGELDDVILRCLKKSPTERYSSAEQLEADLGNFLEGRPVAARGGHAWYRVRKFVARHRVPVAFAAAAFVAVAAAAIVLARKNVELTRERDRAQYAVQFLSDAFVSADPARGAGADITARKILAAAPARLEALFEPQPGLYEQLAGTIGDVQFQLGMPIEAAALLERAIAAARRGADQAELVRLLVLDARALITASKLDVADARLTEAAALGGQQRLDWQLAKGRWLTTSHRGPEAVPVLDAVVKRIADRPPTDLVAVDARVQLAEAYRVAHDYEKALGALEETLAWQQRGLPVDHPTITLTRIRRVAILRRLERNVEAEHDARIVVAEVDKLYGPDSTNAGNARSTLASALDVQGKTAEAIEPARAAVKAYRTTLGEDHDSTLRVTFNLAQLLQKIPEHYDEADRLYAQVIELSTRRYGPKEPTVYYYRLNDGEALLQHGKPTQALAILTAPETQTGLAEAKGKDRSDFFELLQQAVDRSHCTKPAADLAAPCTVAKRLLTSQNEKTGGS